MTTTWSHDPKGQAMTHQHHLADVLSMESDRCTCGLVGYVVGPYVRDRAAERAELRRQRLLRTTEERMIDIMPCGCESGSCYCDTIARDWDAHEARDDARDYDGYPL